MNLMLEILFGILGACSCLCLWRVIRGPSAPDRTVAIDILGLVIVSFCALLSVITKRDFFLSIALVWSLVSFIGTVALAKFLEGRELDD